MSWASGAKYRTFVGIDTIDTFKPSIDSIDTSISILPQSLRSHLEPFGAVPELVGAAPEPIRYRSGSIDTGKKYRYFRYLTNIDSIDICIDTSHHDSWHTYGIGP